MVLPWIAANSIRLSKFGSFTSPFSMALSSFSCSSIVSFAKPRPPNVVVHQDSSAASPRRYCCRGVSGDCRPWVGNGVDENGPCM
jgi:hypothetical protein